MKLPKLGKAESKGWTRIDVTVQAAVIAALSAAVVAGMTSYSGYVSTSQTMRVSCVKRIDDQEDKLRVRAETLLT
jgi:Tfp pilus assembly protein PilE